MGFENGNLVRVVLHAANGAGRDVVNVLHYDLQGGSPVDTANDPQSLADAFRDDVMVHYRALFHASWTISPVIVEDEKDPQNPTSARRAWVSGANAVGTKFDTSDWLPPGICGVAALRTAHIGRRFTGRIFLGGSLTESEQNDGVFGTSLQGLWDSFLGSIPKQPDLAAGVSGATANWVIYSRTQRAQDKDPYASPVTAYLIRPKAHYLRSRAVK